MLGQDDALPAALPVLPRWPSYRQVRRYCRAVMRAIDVEPPLELEALCAGVGALRGRSVTVTYQALPAGVFGFSVGAAAGLPTDHVFAAADTSRLHREHIVLHELGHVLAGHLDVSSSTHGALGELGREREWVAETIATVLSERALMHVRRFGQPPPDPASRVLDEALRSGRAWL